MFLTEGNVLHYLLERRFADLESVVDGAFRVYNLSRRNRNFRVVCGAREYLVKQPRKFDTEGRQGLEQEATVYWQAKTNPCFAPFRLLVPESYGYDPVHSILILEYLAGESLGHRQANSSPAVARLAGAAMGRFHREMRSAANSSQFPRHKPWYFDMHRASDEDAGEGNEGRRELTRLVRKHAAFGQALDALAEEWREETLVHGDWKLENCLLSADGGRIRAVDWELSNWGDPFEDIGTMLQSYWRPWVCQPGRFPIGEVRSALCAFLEGYAAEAGRHPAEIAPRALRFAAARMLQTAYEALDKAERMNADAVCLLQASLNMLTRPQWALGEIFGEGWNGPAV
jgi:aminoglycoside phosphotransferase (APT) family kinase protein